MICHFIKDLKRKEQYLKSSIIIVQSKYLRTLLNLIFKLQRPVANVYMTRYGSETHIQRIRDAIVWRLFLRFKRCSIC